MSQGPVRILALSGSIRRLSANTALLRACADHGSATRVASVHLGDVASLPHFNEDVEAAGFPAPVRELRELAHGCSAVLLSAVEYNHSFSPVLGNAIAWLSRDGPDGPPPLARKPYALVSAAGYSGGMRAQAHLRDTLHSLKMPLCNEPEFLLNLSASRGGLSRFDAATGDVTDAAIRARLAAVVDALAAFTQRLGAVPAARLGSTKLV